MIKSLHYLTSITFGVALLLPLSVPLARANDSPWQLETWQTPYDYQSPSSVIQYTPLEKSSRKWRLCASYPHLKDAYWLSVNYGMVEEAKRLGVSLEVVEAGGYPNMARQISQVKECAKNADILVLGTVSFDGLTKTVLEIAKRIPVVAVVNDIADEGISAKTGEGVDELVEMIRRVLGVAGFGMTGTVCFTERQKRLLERLLGAKNVSQAESAITELLNGGVCI